MYSFMVLIHWFLASWGPGTPVTQSQPSDSLTVYVFLSDECLISQFYSLKLSDLDQAYRSKKVGLIGYFPNPASTAPKVKAFAENYHISFPLRSDFRQELARQFGITVTPEVAVWDHRTEQLIYRGRIDDSYIRVGKRKLNPQHDDLKNIIDTWIKGDTTQDTVITQAIGCFINFTDLKQPLRSN